MLGRSSEGHRYIVGGRVNKTAQAERSSRAKVQFPVLKKQYHQFVMENKPTKNIAERTKLGLRQAMVDGKIVGRPSKLNKEKRKHLLEMINAGQKTQAEMARVFNINRSVISRLISKRRIEEQKAAEPVNQ